MTVSAHQWIGGFNNAATLKTVSDDVPTFQGQLFIVRSKKIDPGILRVRADGAIAVTGFNTLTWLADGMSDEQYLYIQSTYTPGGTGYSANMTIRTLTGYPSGVATFANYNAILQLPKRSDQQDILNAYTGVALTFRIVAAL